MNNGSCCRLFVIWKKKEQRVTSMTTTTQLFVTVTSPELPLSRARLMEHCLRRPWNRVAGLGDFSYR
jgi:hypothetical protein